MTTEFPLAAAELKRRVSKGFPWLVLTVLALLLGFAGVLTLLGSGFLALFQVLPGAAAALLVGAAVGLVGGGTVVVVVTALQNEACCSPPPVRRHGT